MTERTEKIESNVKKYYVDFYDMIDRWGELGFFTERLFDYLNDAIKLCDELNSELDETNKECGEHYGVINIMTGREVYCGQDKKYKKCITEMIDAMMDNIDARINNSEKVI